MKVPGPRRQRTRGLLPRVQVSDLALQNLAAFPNAFAKSFTKATWLCASAVSCADLLPRRGQGELLGEAAGRGRGVPPKEANE